MKRDEFVRSFLIWPFERRDWFVAVCAMLTSFSAYVFTAAPHVTLLDSGEFLTAAQGFGVPHPPGYPFWTFCAWLFSHLLPFGNYAWKINVFSSFAGSLAVGTATLLISNSIHWIFVRFDKKNRPHWNLFGPIIAFVFGLAMTFSVSMWSQCVLTETYPLHTFVIMLFFCSLYRWLRFPQKMGPFVFAMFFYALGFSTHHLTLSLTPVPLLLLVLLKKDHVEEFIIYLAIVAAIAYMGFAYLSDERASIIAASRFLLCAVFALGMLVWFQRRLYQWRYGVLLLLAVAFGLLPYIYMPIASSTNPPMNWGYAREKAGFFWSINRSQYHGSLSLHLLDTVGKVVGAAPPSAAEAPQEILPQRSRVQGIREFAALYWSKIVDSFGWAAMICFLFAFFIILTLDFPRRIWILTLFSSFLLAAFLEAFFNQPNIDLMGWLVQMKYHAYAYALFSIVVSIGAAGMTYHVLRRRKLSVLWTLLWLVVPGYMMINNAGFCSQRDRWFGWHFGHDMLYDLPQSSVFFGGTDPGRFIPTYMIFGESVQPPWVKRDPNFDRRDLYIITQNTLLDPFYLKYLRDQYTEARPLVKNAFERWLGRDRIYPQGPLVLPTQDDINKIIKDVVVENKNNSFARTDYIFKANTAVAEWIFQKNKDKHDFFVEESFKMEWTYPYAIPHGLCYQLSREKLDKIPADVVKKDMRFWKEYGAMLHDNPRFKGDPDAPRTFAKLRTAIGNIYNFRGMFKEAEMAWRQALELWPASDEALTCLTHLLVKQKRFDEAVSICENAYLIDPYNPLFLNLTLSSMRYKDLEEKFQELKQSAAQNKLDKSEVVKLIRSYAALRDVESGDAIINIALKIFFKDADFYKECISYYFVGARYQDALSLAYKLDKLQPADEEMKFMLAKILFLTGNRDEFYRVAKEAVKLGGIKMLQRFQLDPQFFPIKNDAEFQELAKLNANSALRKKF